MNELTVLTTKPSQDFELIDSGLGEKMERYGNVVLSRPDPQALWKKSLGDKDWNNVDAFFRREAEKSGWQVKKEVPERWPIELAGLKFWIRPSAFKHTGVFPEQVGNWEWVLKKIIGAKRKVSVLNLFGYTGGATLAAAKAGAEVCHVDGSKVAIGWARDNAALSGLEGKPIRWILDDARVYVKREIKRGRRYDGVILDPPAFGHGPNKELWKIEDHFLELMDLCQEVLSPEPLFFLLNGYASGYSAIAYANNLESYFKNRGGQIEIGELTIEESKGKRLLPCGIFARWGAKV
ncbi:MAG TPA: class I SAM-dependent methyltransferase [Patescibacteria group bacterium]|nr:class I SAM-dependent methyltransferase [Patescibacteria group bacterium]